MTAVVLDPPGTDPRDPWARLLRLLDPGSAEPVAPPGAGPPDTGVAAVHGRAAGLPVVAYCTDATRMGGALGAAGATHVARAIDVAAGRGVPVVGLWHSGGARLADGVEALDGVGRMFSAMTRASGRVPQVSVVLGPAAGAAAYGPALTDVVVMTEDSRVFVTGPDVVASVTGERVDMAGLGGPAVHGRHSGVAHVVAADEADAYTRARALVRLLGPAEQAGTPPDRRPELRQVIPERRRRAYDVHPVIAGVLDTDEPFQELQPRWAPNVVVGLGRLAGRAVGVVANNPLRKGGCLDARSAEKAARFVRMCDALGVPLVVLVDVPGYLPGVREEWEGVVRRGAKLLHAFAEATVPRVTLVTRKAYGGAYIAMNSRSLGATAVYAWPGAEVAVMGHEAAVGILHRRALAAAPETERDVLRARLVAEHERTAGGVERAVALGAVDAVVDPADTRPVLAAALAGAQPGGGGHGNIPL